MGDDYLAGKPINLMIRILNISRTLKFLIVLLLGVLVSNSIMAQLKVM